MVFQAESKTLSRIQRPRVIPCAWEQAVWWYEDRTEGRVG